MLDESLTFNTMDTEPPHVDPNSIHRMRLNNGEYGRITS